MAHFKNLFALALSFLALTSFANCSGRFINPITDICWDCIFPITVGSKISVKKSVLPDVETDAAPLCACGESINTEVGVNLSFWEPVRTVEIVRHSGCFPSLGGIEINLPHKERDHSKSSKTNTAFWQVHWYQSPWLFITEVIADFGCFEMAPFDLAYLSELDPTWDDPLTSFVLHPDSALFTSGASFAACAVDCISASAQKAINSLYWCSGCQGALFPLSGWIASQVSDLQAWHLLAHRFAVKLARQGELWSAHGKDGQCGYYVQPMLQKDTWRTQLIYPSLGHEVDSTKCYPLGRTTAFWGSFRTFPVTGEDGAILLFRKRDCCVTKSIPDLTVSIPDKNKFEIKNSKSSSYILKEK